MRTEPHRVWFKVLINPILRTAQKLFTDKPYLIASIFEEDDLKGYAIRRIQMGGYQPIGNRDESVKPIPPGAE